MNLRLRINKGVVFAMTTVQDIYDFIDSVAPFAGQLDYDNSGLLVGDPCKQVRAVAVSLDITTETITLAKAFGADLMVSHHPVIYKPAKSFVKGDAAYELAVSGVAAICAHTSLDCAVDGVNDVLADIFSLTRVEVVPTSETPAPMVRVGFLPKPMSPYELACEAAELLDCKLRWCDGGKQIETVAVCGGSGGSLVNNIADMGVDALITGDANYHNFLDAADSGLTLIAAGHFETEQPVIPMLAERLSEQFPDVEVTVLNQKRTIKHL